jgi:hypothetical protein
MRVAKTALAVYFMFSPACHVELRLVGASISKAQNVARRSFIILKLCERRAWEFRPWRTIWRILLAMTRDAPLDLDLPWPAANSSG